MKKIFISLTLLGSTSSFALDSQPITSYGRIGFDDDRLKITIDGGAVYPMTEGLLINGKKSKADMLM